MNSILSRLTREKGFWWGLLIRLALICAVTPITQTQWFYPFIANGIEHFDFHLWQSYLDHSGSTAPRFPFPYGFVMAAVFFPGALAGQGLDYLFSTDVFFGLGFKVTLLAFDCAVLVLLSKLWPSLQRQLIWFFWLSPLAIYVTYWHGQLDIVPVAFLLAVFLYLKSARPVASGIATAIAIAAKLSMVSALPLILVYLWRNKRLHYLRLSYIVGLIFTILVALVPFFFMPGFQQMVLSNPEMQRLYELHLDLGSRTSIYLTPFFYVLALYSLWRLPRISFDLLYAATGLVFFVLIVSTVAPVGWYLWLLPFLAWHQARAKSEIRILIVTFSTLVILGHLALSSGADTPFGLIDGPAILDSAGIAIPSRLYALWQTAVTVIGCILMWQMQRETIRQNDYFRLSRHPLAIAIAGDSGAGKDAFAQRLTELFGSYSVSHLSGDNYHLWDRDGPLWQNLTHLNPRANDLQCFREDTRALLERRTAEVRNYDHALGRYVAPTLHKSNDVVIVSGLHALYDEKLRPRFAVRIYLDTDETVRRYWKLSRDIKERGYEAKKVEDTLRRRQEDAITYIHPQKDQADLILAIRPVHPEKLKHADPASPHYKLHVISRGTLYHEHMALLLVGLCGLHVEMTPTSDLREVEWQIEGDVGQEDIACAAQKLLPHFAEIFDSHAKWAAGMTGVMQLFAVAQIDNNLRTQMI